MSRPIKAGLDYFPHNTDAAGDEKMQSLMALHGPAGYCFYFVMLEKVFRSENGRITCGKPSEKAGLARLMCVTPKQFDAILQTAIEVGCFDKNLYDESQVITSNGVQKRLATVLAVRNKDKDRKIRSESKRKEEKEEIEIENQTRKTLGKLPENPWITTGKLPENSNYLNLFDILWGKYPNKDGKKEALRHFRATVLTDSDAENIENALANYLNSRKVKEGFVKNGSTWFNNWQDWVNWSDPRNQQKKETTLADAYKPL